MVFSTLKTANTTQKQVSSVKLLKEQRNDMRQMGFLRIRKLSTLIACLLATSTSILNAETPSAVVINTIACGNVIDGIADEPVGPRILTMNKGVITSISHPSELHTVDLDLSDHTCLPGLINTHVHFDGIAKFAYYCAQPPLREWALLQQGCYSCAARRCYSIAYMRLAYYGAQPPLARYGAQQEPS